MDALTPFATPLTTLLIIIALLCFKKDVSRLVTWLISFAHFEKTKEGYSVKSAQPLQPVLTSSTQEQALLEVTQEAQQKLTNSASDSKKPSWIDAFLESDYETAAKLIKIEFLATSDDNERYSLRCMHANLVFHVDAMAAKSLFEALITESPTETGAYSYWGNVP